MRNKMALELVACEQGLKHALIMAYLGMGVSKTVPKLRITH